MKSERFLNPIRAGDQDGRGTVYDIAGELIPRPNETLLKTLVNWDVDVISPWRRFMPHTVFAGFHGKASSRLYVTTNRMVLVREIDEWRQLAGDLYPLGLPNAAAKEIELRRLREQGIRQYCEIATNSLRVVAVKEYSKKSSMLALRLLGDNRRQYGLMIWKTDGRDVDALKLLRSRFMQ